MLHGSKDMVEMHSTMPALQKSNRAIAQRNPDIQKNEQYQLKVPNTYKCTITYVRDR